MKLVHSPATVAWLLGETLPPPLFSVPCSPPKNLEVLTSRIPFPWLGSPPPERIYTHAVTGAPQNKLTGNVTTVLNKLSLTTYPSTRSLLEVALLANNESLPETTVVWFIPLLTPLTVDRKNSTRTLLELGRLVF